LGQVGHFLKLTQAKKYITPAKFLFRVSFYAVARLAHVAGLEMHIARRTKAEQEVLALIAPLGKLGRFEEAADFFSS